MDDPFDDEDNEASAVDTSSSLHLEGDFGLNEESKRRVRTDDPNKGRCLIENCPESRSVDFCHCVPRSFTYRRPDLMSSIEWHWKMKYYSLNLDSSHNIFRAGASMRHLFVNNSYLLLPENELIDIYHNALKRIKGEWIAKRETFPDIPNGTNFLYQLIPISAEMEDIAIHRQNCIPDHGGRPKLADFTTHIYPYENMPLLQSHLHPKFVILETGRKLRNTSLSLDNLTDLGNRYPNIKRVVDIYNAWTRVLPSRAEEDKTYGYRRAGGGGGGGGRNGGDDAGPDGDSRSQNGKRNGDGSGGDPPTPDSKHGKHTHHGESGSRKRKNSICLSEKTLIEHERTFGNKKKWLSETVQVWCKEVLDDQALPQLSLE